MSTSPAPTTVTTIGGALIGVSGALLVLQYLGTGTVPALSVLAALALAAGSVALAVDPVRIVGDFRVGRIALLVFGVGPLLFLVPLEATPSPVLLGMSLLTLITIATVVTTVLVAKAGVLHGVARWAMVVVAVDAVVVMAMSSVVLGPVPFIYLGAHLEFVRPLALVVWGVSIVLRGRAPAIRRRAGELNAAWKRSTDVSGTAPEVPVESDVHR